MATGGHVAEPDSFSAPRRKSKQRRLVVVTTVLLVIGLGAAYGLHYLSNPGALSLPGHPALVGYWQGEMTLPGGGQQRMFLELNSRTYSQACDNCPVMD